MNPEEILIKKAAKGDKPAYEQLVNQYKNYVFAIILNFTKDSFHAENIAQEVFLQIYISLPRYRFEGFKAWVGKIALRKAIDWRRKRNITEKAEVLVLQEKDLASYRDKGLTVYQGKEPAVCTEYSAPEMLLIKQENVQRIKDLCKGLPDNYRVVVEKFYFSDKSYKQIAREEGISPRTVETRLYRARKKLKEQWEEEG